MGSIYKYISPIILLIGSIISIWYIVSNLQPLQPALYAFVVCTIISLYLAVKVFSNDLLPKAKRHVRNLAKQKYFVTVSLLALVVIGLFARLFFYFKFSYSPISDPMTFVDSAKRLATEGGLLGDFYVAFQPYLSAYNNLLGVAVRLVPDPWLATILLNTIFDVTASFIVFILLKKMLKPASPLPLVAFGVWILNPLNIMFSAISIPVIVVNFFVVLAMFVSYLLLQQIVGLKTKNALLLSIALGLTLGFGNCFRPIFVVAIIALVIVGAIVFLTARRSTRFLGLFIGCILLITLMFSSIQGLNVAFVSNQTGLQAAKNPSGWSMYVGSDWNSAGQWRQYINDELSGICEKSLAEKKYDECHAALRRAAITRYQNYGVTNSINHLIRKLYHQAEQQNYLYNANQSIVGYQGSKVAKVFNVYLVIYLLALFMLAAISLYRLSRQSAVDQSVSPALLFIALLLVGWFFSLMFVESAPRYSTILYPMFIIFAVLALNNKTVSKGI